MKEKEEDNNTIWPINHDDNFFSFTYRLVLMLKK
jgi:hypothetical protein